MWSAKLTFVSWRPHSLKGFSGALFALLVAGCSGSTGPGGPVGTAGAPGPVATPSGPVTAVDVSTATQITATITSVTIPAAPAAATPVVKLLLLNQVGQPLSGLPAKALSFAVAKLVAAGTQLAAVPPQTTAPAPLVSSQWQSYIYSSVSPAPTSAGSVLDPVVGTTPQPQAYIEPGTVGKLVDNGDGTYQYTFAKDISADAAVPYDPRLTHRVGFEIRGVASVGGATIAANSPVYTFQPSTGATTGIAQYDIVGDQTCKNCHQVLAWHGGARTEVKYCVMCHNPSSLDPSSGNTLDFKVMFHKIHMGQDLPTFTGKSLGNGASTGLVAGSSYYIFGYGNFPSDYSTVAYPQADAGNNSILVSATGQRFCTTCHNANDPLTPQTGNFNSAVSAAACGSCHDDVNFATGQNHGTNIVANDSQCSTCHSPTSNLAGGTLTVVASHQNVVDAAIAKFKYTIVSITNTAPGQTPVATIKVTDPTNGDAPYDITAAGPFKLTGAALNVDVAWNAGDVSNIGSGSATSPTAGSPNQPIVINFASGTTAVTGLTKNADGSFTKTAAFPIPGSATTNPPAGVAASGSGIAALEGRAVVALANNADVTTTSLTQLGVQGVDVAFAIDDPTPTPRAAIVDIKKCNVCHRVLTLHGQNRSDDINLCASCHNPNATDIFRHTNTTIPGSPCAPGTLDNPIDFKFMIHQIHASGDPSAYLATPTNLTGGVTICGFGGNATAFNVKYPSYLNSSLANCNACHNPGTYYPDYTAMQGTTIHAGADRTTLTDDSVITPNSAVCSSCHTDTKAHLHMEQNGGSFAATKTASGALSPSFASTETCSLCHAAGKVADVAVVHRLARFQ